MDHSAGAKAAGGSAQTPSPQSRTQAHGEAATALQRAATPQGIKDRERDGG